MQLLAARLLLSPALVGASSLVGRRFGPRAGGVVAALPIVTGPILLFCALEQGLAFAASAARSSLLGLLPLAAFCVVHAATARAALGLPRRVAAPLCLASGWASFLALAALIRSLHVSAWACAALGAAALLAGLSLVPAVPGDGGPPLRHHPALELVLRMLAAALLVAALTGAAGVLGPAWSGLLASFPVASSVVVMGAHLADGPDTLPETLRGLLLGLFGPVAFLTVLARGLEPLGVARAFSIGFAAAVAVASIAVAFRRRAPEGWQR